jgi:rhamnogalacturonan endolyase
MENLGRGVVAVRSSSTENFISWRVLGTDPAGTAFNLYRATGAGAPQKLNTEPITGATNFTDANADPAQPSHYSVRAIRYGVEEASGAAGAAFTVPADTPVLDAPYLRIPLDVPDGGIIGSTAYTYSANDCSVGDLDGDGEYEIIVKWYPSNAQDNASSGVTGNTYFDAYKLDGTRLWRIDMGPNIRSGAHYTQFMVYDLDGDGKAEMACKTADGTIDGTGVRIGTDQIHRNASGHILGGGEFLTIFDGFTGKALATTNYIPPYDGTFGDTGGNRSERYLACVAYLDGQRPSLVMCRGYYARSVLAAWNWRDGQLTHLWTFDTSVSGTGKDGKANSAYASQGHHNLTVADVDGDGRDEIVYGSCAIDDDGRGLYSTGLGHGDAMHVSDMIPTRPGLEVWVCHETDAAKYGHSLRDAATGEVLLKINGNSDTGRAMAAHIDSRYPGYQVWGSGASVYDATTKKRLSLTQPSYNSAIWWDGDLLRELLDGGTNGPARISKWNANTQTSAMLLQTDGALVNNDSKANACLSGDILGDWREELIVREADSSALRIYVSTAPTVYRIPTLMHDRQYRLSIAWQNVAYNQPPHLSYYLGTGMDEPPRPNIVTSLGELLGPGVPVFTGITPDTGISATDGITSATSISLHGAAEPSSTLHLYDSNGAKIADVPVEASGNWTYAYAATLAAGEHRFTANATNSGNYTGVTTAPYIVTVTTSPPAAPLVYEVAQGDGQFIATGETIPGGYVFFYCAEKGTAPLNATPVQADDNGVWTCVFDAAAFAPGDYTFTADATDAAGNTGSVSATVSINTTVAAPAITGITPDSGVAPDDGIVNTNAVTIRGTAPAGATVALAKAGVTLGVPVQAGVDGAWEIDLAPLALADGAHALSARATSAASTSASSPTFVVTVDTTPPSVLSITRHDPAVFESALTAFTFLVRFNEPVAAVSAQAFQPVLGDGITGGSIIDAQSVAADSAAALVTVGGINAAEEGAISVKLAATPGITDLAGNALPGGYDQGEAYSRIFRGDGVWTRLSNGGAWSDGANWDGGILADGEGRTADFTTLDLTENLAVSLDGLRSVTTLKFGDTDPAATPFGWTINGTGTLALVASMAGESVTLPSIDVDLADAAKATIAVSLAGADGLTKTGAASLDITGKGVFTGGPLNVAIGPLTLKPGGSLTGFENGAIAAAASFVLDGGELQVSGLTTVPSTGVVINSGTASFGEFRSNAESWKMFMNGGLFKADYLSVGRNSAGSIAWPTSNTGTSTGLYMGSGTMLLGQLGLGTNNSNGAMTIAGSSLVQVDGPVFIGWQVSNARGGGIQVTSSSARFIVTDTTHGLVLSRYAESGTNQNANNISQALFNYGVNIVGKVTMGYDAMSTAGSATLQIGANGGALYVGAGGIVKNGTSGMTTTITLSYSNTNSLLGAADDWSSSLPMTLNSNNANFRIKAADVDNNPHDITLNGVISGAQNRGFTKIGGGTLTLGGDNTFAGAVTVSAGTLLVRGSFSSTTNAVTVSPGAYIGGSGTINRPVILSAGAGLALDPNATLVIGSNRALTGSGKVPVRFLNTISTDQATLATFGSTTLTNASFDPIIGPGWTAEVKVSGNTLQLTVTPDTNALDNAIAAAQATLNAASAGPGHGQYPQGAYTALADAIDAASTTGQSTPTTAQIIAALNALQAALDTFDDTPLNTVDFDALDDALATADALLAAVQDLNANSIGNGDGQYPQAALNILKTTIATVKSVRNKQYVTQDELGVALSALQNALTTFDGAVIAVDFSALLAALDDAAILRIAAIEGEGHGQHLPDDIAALDAVIASAEAIAATPAVLQTQVDTAADALQNTMTAFTSAIIDVDFSALDTEIDAADALLATAAPGAGHGQYPQPAIDAFAAALATAQAASGQLGLTPTQVTGALSDLQTAAVTFKAARVVVDFSALETAIDTAATLRLRAIAGEGHGQHAQTAINALADAIDAALTAAAAPAPTQTAIDNARDTLQLAVEDFESAVQFVDFSALTTTIDGADILLASAAIGAAAGEYPQSAADALAAVIGTVKAVAGKLGVTQTEADTARRMLENAMAAFEAAIVTAADVAAPRITRHPVAQTIRPGATASFTAAATGNGLRYQWQKDGVDIAGATTDALFITNAKYADTGVYRVIVTNDYGAATSYDARLTLEEPSDGGGGGAPAWPIPVLLAALLVLRAVIHRRRVAAARPV